MRVAVFCVRVVFLHTGHAWNTTIDDGCSKCQRLPPPMTASIVMHEASISFVNSYTALVGSSYVWGST